MKKTTKPQFSLSVLTIGVAAAFGTQIASAADVACSNTSIGECHYVYNTDTGSIPQWQQYKNYYAWTHDGATLDKVNINDKHLKLTASGNFINKPAQDAGYIPSTYSSSGYERRGINLINMSAMQTPEATGEFEMLPNSSATLSMQPENSSIIYLADISGKIGKGTKLTVNPSFAEINKVDLTQFGEETADDYDSSAIEVSGSRGHLTTSANIEINAKDATALRTFSDAVVEMSDHSIQLNAEYSYGFDTWNTGKITTDNVKIKGNGKRTTAFAGSNIHFNNSLVDLTGQESLVTIVANDDVEDVVQNINNSKLNADYGIWLSPEDKVQGSHVMNLTNSELAGRSGLMIDNATSQFYPDASEFVGNVVINANNSQLSGATLLDTSDKATENRNITFDLSNNSTWNIKQNSELDNLKLSNSTVDLTNNTTGQYNTLTLTGDLTGNGTFRLNTDIAHLQGDQLVVKGTVSGSHILAVNNTTAEPKTTDGKLTLVNITKASDGTFTLKDNKPVEAGKYLYTLKKEGNDWQLVYNNQSSPVTPTPVTPTPVTPTPVTPTPPIVNKNLGYTLHSRLAHAQATAQDLQAQNNNLNSRQTALHREQRLHGLWLQGEHGLTERKSSTVNDATLSGFSQKTSGWQLGYDHAFEQYYAGALVGQSHHDLDYDLDVYDKTKLRGTTIALYGGITLGNNWFIDSTLRYTHYKAQSPQATLNDGHFNITSINMQAGKNIALNTQWQLVPQAAVTIARLSGSDLIDDSTLLQTRIGTDVMANFDTANGTRIQPKFGIYYLGDHKKANVTLNDETFNAPNAGSRIAAKAGVDVSFSTQNHLSANIQTEHGSRVNRPYVLDIGFTHRW